MNTHSEMAVSIELLATAFTSEHYPALFRGQHTHDPGLRLVGQLVQHTRDIDWITRIVASALPKDYAGNLLDEIPSMVAGAERKGYDRPSPGATARAKTTISDRILAEFEASGATLFHDKDRRGFISVQNERGGTLNFPVQSTQARNWLHQRYFTATGKAASGNSLADVLALLDARAKFGGPRYEVALRYARFNERVFVDLGREDAMVVEITPEGWSTAYACPVKFYRGSGFAELPEPTQGATISTLRDLLRLEDETYTLVLAFLLNAIRPTGPYMCLLVEGEQGSGKSVLCDLVKRIVDPNAATKIRLPDNERDLMIQAKEMHLIVYDNSSGMRSKISDALCSLSTGGGVGVRKLYTDDELSVITVLRPFIINGISDVANRPDLLERAIAVKLPTMEGGARRTEAEIFEALDRALPAILGFLYSAIATALIRAEYIPAPTSIRMADSAMWLAAAEPATGLPAGTFMNALESSQHDLMVDRIINQPVVLALQRVLQHGPFEGTMGDLFDRIGGGQERNRRLPSTAAHLSKTLDRLRPALKLAGIGIEHLPKTRRGRFIKVWEMDGDAPTEKPQDERPKHERW